MYDANKTLHKMSH